MTRYADTIRNQLEAPLPGVSVYVYTIAGALAELEEDGGGDLANPVSSDAYGGFYFNAADGIYELHYYYGGKLILRDRRVVVGAGPELPDEIIAALSAPNGATLIGSDDDADGGLWTSVASFITSLRSPTAGTSLVAHKPLGTFTIPTTTRALLRDLPLTPAVSNLVNDDGVDNSTALAELLDDAITYGLGLQLGQGARYGVGTDTDISFALGDTGLRLDGNGATIIAIEAPTQLNVPGNAGNPIFKFAGTSDDDLGQAEIDRLHFDLGGFAISAFSFYRCDVDIRRGRFRNGHARNSYMVQAHHSSGKLINLHGADLCDGFYLGYTGGGGSIYNSFDFEVASCSLVDNPELDEGPGLTNAGHLVLGTYRDTFVHHNFVRNVRNFLIMSGYDVSGQACERITIANNRGENIQASTIQSDILIAAAGIRSKVIKITGNQWWKSDKRAWTAPVGHYMLHAEDWTIEDETFIDYENCLVADETARGTFRDSSMRWTGAVPGGNKIGVLIQGGTPANVTGSVTGGTSDIDLDNLTIDGFTIGMVIAGTGGEAYSVSDIRTVKNTIKNCTTGLIRGLVTGGGHSISKIKIANNELFANTTDLRVEGNHVDDELEENTYATFAGAGSAVGPTINVGAGAVTIVVGRAKTYLITDAGSGGAVANITRAAAAALPEGRVLRFVATNAVTFTHGTLACKGAVDAVLAAGDEIEFRKRGGVIREVSRNF